MGKTIEEILAEKRAAKAARGGRAIGAFRADTPAEFESKTSSNDRTAPVGRASSAVHWARLSNLSEIDNDDERQTRTSTAPMIRPKSSLDSDASSSSVAEQSLAQAETLYLLRRLSLLNSQRGVQTLSQRLRDISISEQSTTSDNSDQVQPSFCSKKDDSGIDLRRPLTPLISLTAAPIEKPHTPKSSNKVQQSLSSFSAKSTLIKTKKNKKSHSIIKFEPILPIEPKTEGSGTSRADIKLPRVSSTSKAKYPRNLPKPLHATTPRKSKFTASSNVETPAKKESHSAKPIYTPKKQVIYSRLVAKSKQKLVCVQLAGLPASLTYQDLGRVLKRHNAYDAEIDRDSRERVSGQRGQNGQARATFLWKDALALFGELRSGRFQCPGLKMTIMDVPTASPSNGESKKTTSRAPPPDRRRKARV